MLRRCLRLSFVVVMTLGGAFIGIICLAPFLLSTLYQYDHGFGETAKSNIVGMTIGASIGGSLAILTGKSRRPSTD